jgi:hypothetical protein
MTNRQWIRGWDGNWILSQKTKATIVKDRVHDRALDRVIPPPNDQFFADRTPIANTRTSRQDTRSQDVTIAETTDLDAVEVA